MYWNYNIVKTKDGYGLYEVYFDDKWDKPFTRTKDPIYFGDDEEEVKRAIEMMHKDSYRNPVINDEDIKEENNSEGW